MSGPAVPYWHRPECSGGPVTRTVQSRDQYPGRVTLTVRYRCADCTRVALIQESTPTEGNADV